MPKLKDWFDVVSKFYNSHRKHREKLLKDRIAFLLDVPPGRRSSSKGAKAKGPKAPVVEISKRDWLAREHAHVSNDRASASRSYLVLPVASAKRNGRVRY